MTATRDSVVAVRGISETIGRISEIASTTAAAVEQQGAATNEIANNVEDAPPGGRWVRGFVLNGGRLVPLAGIEPALLAELDFESSASTSSATGAFRGLP
jgi:hypothetical protein